MTDLEKRLKGVALDKSAIKCDGEMYFVEDSDNSGLKLQKGHPVSFIASGDSSLPDAKDLQIDEERVPKGDLEGRILFANPRAGFGFVGDDDFKVFFSTYGVDDAEFPIQGLTVKYNIVVTPTGLKAKGIRTFNSVGMKSNQGIIDSISRREGYIKDNDGSLVKIAALNLRELANAKYNTPVTYDIEKDEKYLIAKNVILIPNKEALLFGIIKKYRFGDEILLMDVVNSDYYKYDGKFLIDTKVSYKLKEGSPVEITSLNDFPFGRKKGVIVEYGHRKSWGYIADLESLNKYFFHSDSVIQNYPEDGGIALGAEVRFDVIGNEHSTRATRIIIGPNKSQKYLQRGLQGTIESLEKNEKYVKGLINGNGNMTPFRMSTSSMDFLDNFKKRDNVMYDVVKVGRRTFVSNIQNVRSRW